MKKWEVLSARLSAKQAVSSQQSVLSNEEVIETILQNRGITSPAAKKEFLHSKNPLQLTPEEVGIDQKALEVAAGRIIRAIEKKESIIVYADYDADGITAGAILWEAIYALGGRVMPYIPHRVDEGYGLSHKGIDAVKQDHGAQLIVTVDHGITAREKVAYAKELGIDVIVTDHHSQPAELPDCPIVHTIRLSGSGVSWYVAMQLLRSWTQELPVDREQLIRDYLSLATIGTIADLLPLTGVNRSLVKYGLVELSHTRRVGILALFRECSIPSGPVDVYQISHMVAPRLNAMGRLEHAMEALRLLCTKKTAQAEELSAKLSSTNTERQQLTVDTVLHAKAQMSGTLKKLLFISHESYNQGVIGLVAGKLTEEYYRPAVVVSVGEQVSKASARSIAGFNIVDAIRQSSDLLLEVGGHPMAAGFSVETRHLVTLQARLEELAEQALDEEALKRVLKIDMELPLSAATEALWMAIQDLSPFGFGNYEPVFMSRDVKLVDARVIGNGGKHLKLRVSPATGDLPAEALAKEGRRPATSMIFDAIGFGMAELYPSLHPDKPIDIAYTLDMNEWNGRRSLQLKLKDIHVS